MGRHAYNMAEGNFTGYEYRLPIFVLTHDAPEKVAKGENEKLTFMFVTDGIESAIEKARAAAEECHGYRWCECRSAVYKSWTC